MAAFLRAILLPAISLFFSWNSEFVLRTLSSLHWALDLEKALAELIGQSISTLIQGGAISTDETSCQKWLDSKLLSSGFDDVPTGLEIYKKEFLDELVNTPATDTESEARTLATYMHRHITAKKPLASIGGEIGNLRRTSDLVYSFWLR